MIITKPDRISGLRIYDEARVAHLERIIESSKNIQFLYHSASYDFSDDLAKSANAKKSSLPTVLREIIKTEARIIELNEPLYIKRALHIVIYIFTINLKKFFTNREILVVSYAIENADIAAKLSSHTKIPYFITKRVLLMFLRVLLLGIDRIAFGTESAFTAYKSLARSFPRHLQTTIIAPIEKACETCELIKHDFQVMFLGALDERKGIDAIMDAWPLVIRQFPNATLKILGKGPREDAVIDWVNSQRSTRIIIDPSRAEIHEELSSTTVLVLLSRTTPRWREQIGLPIIEGLSHACRIVATSATGISDWLKKHGHFVIDNPNDSDCVAAAIVAALNSRSLAQNILQSLPTQNGRTVAEDWLWK